MNKAQGTRMKVIAENLANADSAPEKPGGTPYRRQVVNFANTLNREIGARTVEVSNVSRSQADFRMKYMPNHPAANEKGYVKMPNVNPLIELNDMRESQRSYEANMQMINTVKSIMKQASEMLK